MLRITKDTLKVKVEALLSTHWSSPAPKEVHRHTRKGHYG